MNVFLCFLLFFRFENRFRWLWCREYEWRFCSIEIECKKACFFFHDEASELKCTEGRVHFHWFLVMKHAKFRKTFFLRRLRCVLQRWGIKIGGSGGGSKSRSRCVFGCANGAGVGEIALVIFYYSIIRDRNESEPSSTFRLGYPPPSN